MTAGRVRLAGVCGVLATAGIGAAAWWMLHGQPEGTETPEPVPVTSPATEVAEVTAALESLPSNPEALLSAGTRSDLQSTPDSAFPEGTTIEVDEASWRPDQIGGGLIEVSVTRPGLGAVNYLAVMAKEGEQWRVLTTFSTE